VVRLTLTLLFDLQHSARHLHASTGADVVIGNEEVADDGQKQVEPDEEEKPEETGETEERIRSSEDAEVDVSRLNHDTSNH
jgi:hypothetical protein